MAGLPWIPVHTDLPQHPKSMSLGIKLGEERAWSYVVQLWLWAASHAPEGRVDGAHAGQLVARASGWTKDPDQFITAMVEARFLDHEPDGSLTIHDWDEYARAHIEKRERDRDRMREYREQKANSSRTVAERSGDVAKSRAHVAGKSEIERETDTEKKQKQAASADQWPLLGEFRVALANRIAVDADWFRISQAELVQATRDGLETELRRLTIPVAVEVAAEACFQVSKSGRRKPQYLRFYLGPLQDAVVGNGHAAEPEADTSWLESLPPEAAARWAETKAHITKAAYPDALPALLAQARDSIIAEFST